MSNFTFGMCLITWGLMAFLFGYRCVLKELADLAKKYGRLNDAAQDYFEKPNAENQTKLLEIIDPENTRGHR